MVRNIWHCFQISKHWIMNWISHEYCKLLEYFNRILLACVNCTYIFCTKICVRPLGYLFSFISHWKQRIFYQLWTGIIGSQLRKKITSTAIKWHPYTQLKQMFTNRLNDEIQQNRISNVFFFYLSKGTSSLLYHRHNCTST